MRKKHPGFKAVKAECMRKNAHRFSGERLERYCGGGIANAARRASTTAKRRNPRLKRVRGR